MFLFHHIAITAVDLKATQAFYSAFGLRETKRIVVGERQITVFMQLGHFFLEIFYYKNSEIIPLDKEPISHFMKKTGLKHLCLKVQDIEKARIHLMEAGIEDVPEASLLPFGNVKCFSIRDPNGIWIEILQDNNFFSAGKSMPINDSDIVYLT